MVSRVNCCNAVFYGMADGGTVKYPPALTLLERSGTAVDTGFSKYEHIIPVLATTCTGSRLIRGEVQNCGPGL
jgi:hypothetical protein